MGGADQHCFLGVPFLPHGEPLDGQDGICITWIAGEGVFLFQMAVFK